MHDDGAPPNDPLDGAIRKMLMDQMRKKETIPDLVVEIEEEHIETLLALHDDMMSIEHQGDALARYRLWKKAEEIYPQIKGGSCTLNLSKACQPFIEVRFVTNKVKEKLNEV